MSQTREPFAPEPIPRREEQYLDRVIDPSLAPVDLDHLAGIDRIRTPALVIGIQNVDHNLSTAIGLMGSPNRWRPHVKAARLRWTMRKMVEHGISCFKCATTLDLVVLGQLGVKDVLIAYPLVGPTATRVGELAATWPRMRISALVDRVEALQEWPHRRVEAFLDLDVGMHRTGVPIDDIEGALRVAEAVSQAGVPLRGLHSYDGHLDHVDPAERASKVRGSLDKLCELVEAFSREGLSFEEIITSGSTTWRLALAHGGLASTGALHRVSPGAIVYGDLTSLAANVDAGLVPAAGVISRVISAPLTGSVTCDAGHKAVSSDDGIPTCAIVGRPDLIPQRPSEEHLVVECMTTRRPPIGDVLLLVPRHVCTTVNNFNQALLVDRDRVVALETVSARGREPPIGGNR